MEGDIVDESELFRAVWKSGVRSLLIGRQAVALYGIPVVTADYDYWIEIDRIEPFNAALAALGLAPTCEPAVARTRGRYALEGHDKVDVCVSRVFAIDSGPLSFEDAWLRRVEVRYDDEAKIAVPSLEDLILTKRAALRPHDIDDINRLRDLLTRRPP